MATGSDGGDVGGGPEYITVVRDAE